MDDALGSLRALKNYRNIYGPVFPQRASTAPLFQYFLSSFGQLSE